MGFNEIKLSTAEANLYINFDGYISLVRLREKNGDKGGGVAILVKSSLQFTQDLTFDVYQRELLAIRILGKNNKSLLFVCLYNPPKSDLSKELFHSIAGQRDEWVVMGDLNSKLISLGYETSDDKGLEDILLETNGLVLNSLDPTWRKFRTTDHFGILTLCICSPGIPKVLNSLTVLPEEYMGSDHFPVCASIGTFNDKISNPQSKKTFCFARADWKKFKENLPINITEIEDKDSEKLAEFITAGIKESALKNIPYFREKKKSDLPLHPAILHLIKEKRWARKNWELHKKKVPFSNSMDFEAVYKQASKRVKAAIRAQRNKTWSDFLAQIGPNFVSSRKAWQKINAMRTNQSTKRGIPCLYSHEGLPITKDLEKANHFKEILKKRFSGTSEEYYDREFKLEAESFVAKELADKEKITNHPVITLRELEQNIKRLKSRSAPGKDGIYNTMLANLSVGFIHLILKLFNMCLKEGNIPATWKKSLITMILKGSKLASNANNYRPISLISCLSKLLERIIGQRLSGILEENNIISRQQSGFRRFRRTTDNLAFHTQKVMEAFNKKGRKVLTLSFDIQAAFDAVWHEGLIYKMLKYNIPRYLINWTRGFLSNRSFEVKVNDSITNPAPIITGVPQGSSISPILFGIFINDIPMGSPSSESYSLLFADDLTTSFFYDKIKISNENVSYRVSEYLREIEKWLCKWRLKMSPEKCSYSVFAKGNSAKNKFGFRLLGKEIPHDKTPTTLGITFDECLNFKKHLKKLKAKCLQRLDIIKILSHRSWKLNHKTLVSIYNSLIGSVIDYSAFMYPVLSESARKSIQAIQNGAVRLIFHRSKTEHLSTETLCNLSNLITVETRMEALNARYFSKAISNRNPLVIEMIEDYWFNFGNEILSKKTLLCDQFEK